MKTAEKTNRERSTEKESTLDFGILRVLRKREGMSIAELSERSGVSASVISKLERNRTSAETDTLCRIARTFQITLSDLICLAERQSSHSVRADQYRSGDFLFERVSYNHLRCMHAEAAAGARLSTPELHRDDYELCWVLRGCLRLSLPEEELLLRKGMAVQFDALLRHSYETLEDTELVIVHLQKPKRF